MSTTPASVPPGFEADIKAMFRPRDHGAMSRAFDLWSYEDVSRHAEAIVDRVRSGSMPCDIDWPTSDVDRFQAWIDAGKLP